MSLFPGASRQLIYLSNMRN